MANGSSDPYGVHDIAIADRPVFTPGGKVQSRRTVTYFIGTHGPFYIEDDPAALTTDVIKAGIKAHQDQLRTLDDLTTPQGS